MKDTSTLAVKFAAGSDDVIEGFGIPFGGPFDGKDWHGEFFSKNTDLCLSWFKERPLLYSHGLDGKIQTDPVGVVKEITLKADGWWVRAQLDKSKKYWEDVKKVLDKKALFFSSGSLPHLVKMIKESGEITRWPLIEMTLTPSPANPDATLDLMSAEKHYGEAGIEIHPGIKAMLKTDGPSETIRLVNAALSEAFKLPADGDGYERSRFYWASDVLDDYVVSEESETSKLFRISYSIDKTNNVTFGEPTEVKREYVDVKTKSVSGKADFPIAARDTAWDASAADKRVRDWAKATDAPNAKYRSAFFWYDAEKSDQFGSYKLGFADVVDGKLTAIPRAIFAVAAVLQGGRGGVSIPDSDKEGVKTKVSGYYTRMAKEFEDDSIEVPWATKSLISRLTGKKDFDKTLAEMTAPDIWDVWCAFQCELRNIEDLVEASEGSALKVDAGALIDDLLKKFTAKLRAVSLAFIDYDEDESGEDGMMSVRSIALEKVKAIINAKQGGPLVRLSLADHSEAVLAANEELFTRIKAVRDMRVKEGRAMNADRLKRLTAIHSKIGEAHAQMGSMIEEIQPSSVPVTDYAEKDAARRRRVLSLKTQIAVAEL